MPLLRHDVAHLMGAKDGICIKLGQYRGIVATPAPKWSSNVIRAAQF